MREYVAKRPGVVFVMVGQQKVLDISEMRKELREDRGRRGVYQKVIEHITPGGKIQRGGGGYGTIEIVLTTATKFSQGRDPWNGL